MEQPALEHNLDDLREADLDDPRGHDIDLSKPYDEHIVEHIDVLKRSGVDHGYCILRSTDIYIRDGYVLTAYYGTSNNRADDDSRGLGEPDTAREHRSE